MSTITTIPGFDVVIAVRISFRKHGDGELTAVFLDQMHDGKNMVCYSHIGQHSSCDVGWVRKTKPAKPSEYSCLKSELESQGYSVTVQRRMTYPRPGEIVCPKCGAKIKPDKSEYERICREEDRNVGFGFTRMSLDEWAKRNHECKIKTKRGGESAVTPSPHKKTTTW